MSFKYEKKIFMPLSKYEFLRFRTVEYSSENEVIKFGMRMKPFKNSERSIWLK